MSTQSYDHSRRRALGVLSVVNAVICGMGAEGYSLEVRAVADLLKRAVYS